jgi:multiple sugar transport system substrate-binding protein
MAKNKKKTLIFACIITLALLSFFVLNCQKSDGKKVLRISTWDQGSYVSNLLKQAFEAYEKQHANLSVKFEMEPWQHYWTKLQTQIIGGTAPDIMIFGESSLHSFAENDAFLNLQPMIEEEKYDLSDFYEVAVETGRWNGNLYALPTMMEVPALFYVKDAFDATGVPYPKAESMTWDEFLELCKKLTLFDADGKVKQYGYVEEFGGLGFLSWIRQNNGGIVAPIVKPKRCILNSPEAIEAAQFYFDLGVKYHYTPTILDYKTEAMGDPHHYLRSKNCALYQASSISVYFFDQNIKGYGVVPMPHKKRRSNLIKINFLCISSKTKYPKEAWELLKYMVGPVQEIIAENYDSIPSRKSVATTKFLVAHPDIRDVFLDELKYSEVAMMTDKYMELSLAQTPFLDQIASGKISVPEAMNGISSKVTAVLEGK